MDVRLLEQADIPQAKVLWSEAFGDSEAFIDWYFANKISSGNSLGAFDGRLVSVIHMIPLNVCVQGRPLESAYIAGAATAGDRRGEGLMRTLLHESLKLMKERGITMTHLYPFKHSFYENFGWSTYSYVRNISVKTGIEQQQADIIESGDERLFAPVYERMMSGFDGYIIRGSREWRWRLEEHASDGGKTAVLIKCGKPAAYILYNSEGGKADVIETAYTERQDIQTLLAYILNKGHEQADYFIPAEESAGVSPYGMARIVDAQALLKLFQAEELLEYIRIRDDFAEWNSIGAGEEMDIRDLTKIVHQGPDFGGSVNAISRRIYNIIMKLFMSEGTCIFEQY